MRDLIIAGAGPVGLTAAIVAKQNGLDVVVLERDLTTVTQSRAIWIHPRTLEIWNSVGLAELALAEGRIVKGIQVSTSGSARAILPYDGSGLSEFPYGLMLEQSKTQEILAKFAERIGIPIRWGDSLVAISQSKEGVTVTTETTNGKSEIIEGKYLLGADGGSSTVRKQLEIKLDGGTYNSSFFVADVEADTDLNPDLAHLNFHSVKTVAVLPLPGEGRFRLIGNMPKESSGHQEPGYGRSLDLMEVRDLVSGSKLPMSVKEIGWTTTYRSHHRVANSFISGRVALAGDAAHLHSPAGGLGMNTGVADAHNFVHKLLDATDMTAPFLLNLYNSERRGVAQSVIDTSDKLFTLQADTRKRFGFVRNHILPNVIGFISKQSWGKSLAFKVLSGTTVAYTRRSGTSLSRLGTLRFGSRFSSLQIPVIQKSELNKHLLLISPSASSALSSQAEQVAATHHLLLKKLEQTTHKTHRLPRSDWLVWVRRDGHIEWMGSDFRKLSVALEKHRNQIN